MEGGLLWDMWCPPSFGFPPVPPPIRIGVHSAAVTLLLCFWSTKENILWQEEHRSNRPVKTTVISPRPYFCHCIYQGAWCYTFTRKHSLHANWWKDSSASSHLQILCVIGPQSLREWKEGLSTPMEIFASLPLSWPKAQLKLHHFVTLNMSITILSCNNYSSQFPINPCDS